VNNRHTLARVEHRACWWERGVNNRHMLVRVEHRAYWWERGVNNIHPGRHKGDEHLVAQKLHCPCVEQRCFQQ